MKQMNLGFLLIKQSIPLHRLKHLLHQGQDQSAKKKKIPLVLKKKLKRRKIKRLPRVTCPRSSNPELRKNKLTQDKFPWAQKSIPKIYFQRLNRLLIKLSNLEIKRLKLLSRMIIILYFQIILQKKQNMLWKQKKTDRTITLNLLKLNHQYTVLIRIKRIVISKK